MKGTLVLLALVAGVAAGSTIAYATTADSPKVHACYKKPGGQLRLGTVCGKKERPVAWSVVGPQGPAGPAGPAGVQGPVGPTGAAGYEVVNTNSAGLPNLTSSSTSVSCPSGKRPTGGGAKANREFKMLESYPSSATEWTVKMRNDTGSTAIYTVYAVCVTAS
jgi:hypothetical protein